MNICNQVIKVIGLKEKLRHKIFMKKMFLSIWESDLQNSVEVREAPLVIYFFNQQNVADHFY